MPLQAASGEVVLVILIDVIAVAASRKPLALIIVTAV